MDQLEEALAELEVLTADIERTRGGHDALLGGVADLKGTYEVRLGRPDAAEVSLRRALQLWEGVEDASPTALAHTLSKLANLRSYKGASDEAMELYARAEAVLDGVPDDNAASRTNILCDWAAALGIAGRHAEAAELFSRALVYAEQAYSPTSPSSASVWAMRSAALRRAGQPLAALRDAERSLEILAEGRAKPSAGIARAAMAKGLALVELERFEAALDPLESALPALKAEGQGARYHAALVEFGLARALVGTHQQHNRAITLARTARDVFLAQPNAGGDEAKAATHWLRAHASSH